MATGHIDFNTTLINEKVKIFKNELVQAGALSLPKLNEEFVIEADASDKALGAVLKQNLNGNEKTIQFASRNSIAAERNYSTTEKKTLVIIFAIKQFRIHLYNHFTIKTDHKSLLWLKTPQG